MINRHLSEILTGIMKKMPVITLTGPRQSGKTTLVKHCFSDFTYLNLEETDKKELALTDPRLFFEIYQGNLIIDEAQNVPDIFSWVQVLVDSRKGDRKFILTGSQNFLLLERISQSLAGRTSILQLFPFSMEELKNTSFELKNYHDYIFKGFYPRLYDQDLNPVRWLDDYLISYIERDVRTIINVGDLIQFQRFVRLCAGRIGQLVNFSQIGNELGISYHTVQKWLSVLEASFIVFRLQPWYSNYNKRIIKTSKLYFYDTGLASNLLGIKSSDELNIHFMRGALFENLIISELAKAFYNTGQRPPLYFWRDNSGNEIDCLIEAGQKLIPVEIKSGSTVTGEWLKGIRFFQKLSGTVKPENSFLIYGGEENQIRTECNVVSWKDAVRNIMKCISFRSYK
jgi:predicted AAA+ superfamily ATPase